MKKRIHSFQTVNFKIAVVFVLLLLIFVEIIGAIFIRQLERTTINNFESTLNSSVDTLATNISSELSKSDQSTNKATLRRMLAEFAKSEILEARVVDDKGIVVATSDGNQQSIVGKKNDSDYGLSNGLTQKRQEAKDPKTGKLIYVNVQQIYSPTGDTALGILYVKSDIASKYEEVQSVALIFFSASMIALAISMVLALLVARNITKPIAEMQQYAVKIAQGDYSGKVRIYGQDELGQLGETFNELSVRISEAQETLEAERHRLDSVLSHMSDGVIATDRRGKVIIINEMALMLLNVNNEEAIGQPIVELLNIQKEHTLRSLLESQVEMHLNVPTSEGREMILRAEFSMIRRESGFISGLVCVLHDVTEQEKNERERREFVSNVSHELRTPLTSTRSYVEALNDGAWQDKEIAPQFLNVIQEETDRMIRMINDLLRLSRMDAQKEPLRMELINLNELLNFVLDRFDMMIKSKNQPYSIRREFTNRSIWVDADADKMIQVLDNILNNALKYSPMGGTITCRLIETHRNVVISISDQGLGIPKKDLNRVFDRFYRVDKARSREMGGSGLGLAITKEVVKEHGGTIWAESKEGKGSTFYISLPYEPYEEDLWL